MKTFWTVYPDDPDMTPQHKPSAHSWAWLFVVKCWGVMSGSSG